MSNYRCYLCNQEFIFLRGLEKHYDNDKCPRVTPEMKADMLNPFFRILTEVTYVDPKRLVKKEKFVFSYNVETVNPGWKERLLDNTEALVISLDSKSSTDLSDLISTKGESR